MLDYSIGNAVYFEVMSVSNMQAKQYLPHITGLRGIAIILILLFHISKAFPNGYIGVHVFLVISGYFLFRDFWNDNYEFSLGEFCSKKIARLFPCAIVVSIFTCIAALCFLPYNIVLQTAKSAIATILGCSNVYYDYTYSDYFAASSISNPLVHTWYLGVIIQLYIIAACIKIICKSRSRIFKLALLSILFVASALLYYKALWIGCVDPFQGPIATRISTYYWTWGHLWMLLAGAYASLLLARVTKVPCKALGNLALFFTCVLGLLPLQLTAGHACLLDITVVCTSVACICYGGTSWSNIVLNNPVVSIIGKVSFSLYLVHWPVISIFAQTSAHWNHNVFLKLLVLSITCLATWLMYRWIEQRRFNAKGVLAAWASCMLACIFLIYSNGMRGMVHVTADTVSTIKQQVSGDVRPIESGPMYDSLPDFRPVAFRAVGGTPNIFEKVPLLYQLGDGSKTPDYILMGDSHAQSLFTAFDVISQEEGWSGVYLHTYVVPFTRYYSERRPYQLWNTEKQEQLLQYLKQNANIRTVFIANFWLSRFGKNYCDADGKVVDVEREPEKDYFRFRDYIYQIHSLGKQVVIIRDVPMVPIKDIANYIWFCTQYKREVNASRLTVTREMYDDYNKIANEYISRLESEGLCRVLRADDAIFQQNPFRCYQNGEFYYYDDNHVTQKGAVMVVRYLKEAVRSILEAKGGE